MTVVISEALKNEFIANTNKNWPSVRENLIKMYAKHIFNAVYCDYETALKEAEKIVDERFSI